MIQSVNLGNLYDVDSIVEIVRLYWHIMAHKRTLVPDNNQRVVAESTLSCIKAYRENVPSEIQEKINFEDLDGLERKCRKMLEEN